MGVPSIVPLISKNPSLFKPLILRKCSLIVDGKCLENYLYNNIEIDKECGGDYDVYARKVEAFFNTLHKFEVNPIVVFDGGYEQDDRKLATLKTRAQNRINDPMKFAPLLIHETFLSTIKNMNIRYVICDFEADHEMVVLANRMRCPLLSFDSDFFIFELAGGYIPIAEMKISLLTSGEDIPRIEVKVFHTRYLVAKFPFLKDKLPLFASALGNDYVAKESDSIQEFYKDLKVPKPDRNVFEIDDGHFCAIIRKVLYWLEVCGNQGIGKNQLMKHMDPAEKRAVEISLDTYANFHKFSTFDLDLFIKGSIPEETSELIRSTSKWMVRNHRLGKLPNFIQNTILNQRTVLLCQVEDIIYESSHACSKPIRQIIYGILLGRDGKVEELDRKGDKLEESTVKGIVIPLEKGVNFANKDNINSMNRATRLEILQKAMTAPLPSENLVGFSRDAALFAMVLIFWLKSSNYDVTSGLVSSLLLCFIILSILNDETVDPEIEREVKHIKDSLGEQNHQTVLTVRHPLAQFQSCLKHCIYLNKLLDCPIADINPATAFSGSLVNRLFHHVQRYGDRRILSKLRKNVILSDFYVDALDFVRNNV